MQGINDIQTDEFPTAEELKELTATKEELFDKIVHDTKVNIMSSMVRLAKEQGKTSYGAQFRKEEDTTFINKVADDFRELGYEVNLEDGVNNIGGASVAITTLTVSWG